MIDVLTDRLIPITALADRVPLPEGVNKPSPATLQRWATKGLRGAVLETVRVGNGRYTTTTAFSEFCRAASHYRPRPASPAAPAIADPARVRADKAVAAAAEALGF